MMTESEYRAFVEEAQNNRELSDEELGQKMASIILDLPEETRVVDLLTPKKSRYFEQKRPPQAWLDLQKNNKPYIRKMNDALRLYLQTWSQDLGLFSYESSDPINATHFPELTVKGLIQHAQDVIQDTESRPPRAVQGYWVTQYLCETLVEINQSQRSE